MRRLTTASLVLAFFVGPAVAALVPVHSAAGHWNARGCSKLFTVRMARRAAIAVYARRPSRRELVMLGRIERCQRNPRARWYVRWFYGHERAVRAARLRASVDRTLPTAVASWYEDAGSTACGYHAGYGVAHKSLPCGTRVLICFPAGSSRCVEATVDDRGPFVAGRTFDLNQTVAGALGFGGVASISYRLGG